MAVDKSNKLVLLKAIKAATVKMKAYADDLISSVAQAAAEAIEEHANRKDNPHGVTAEQVKALPLTGGTLTGNLTGKYITGTWLQATAEIAMANKIRLWTKTVPTAAISAEYWLDQGEE